MWRCSRLLWVFVALVSLMVFSAHRAAAQPYTAYPATNGQIPTVVITCPPAGSGASTPQSCSFGSGGGSNPAAIAPGSPASYGTPNQYTNSSGNAVNVTPTNGLPTDDLGLDGIISNGALQTSSDTPVAATGNITTQNLNPNGVATAGSAVTLAINGQGVTGVGIQGTYTGTLSIQLTVDNVNWISPTTNLIRNVVTGSLLSTISSGSIGLWQFDSTNMSAIRITALGPVTGAAVITLRGGSGQHMVALEGGNAAVGQIQILGQSFTAMDVAVGGGSSAGRAIQNACYYLSTPSALTTGQSAANACDTTRALYVNEEGQKATYSTVATVTLASAATDFFEFCGIASKETRLRSISLQGYATTATTANVQVIKRSAADTGGTFAAASVTSLDSANGAAAPVAQSYTANPSGLGTAVGTLRVEGLQFPLIANEGTPLVLTFGSPLNEQAIVLRSASECIGLNLNGATVTGGVVQINNIDFTVN